MNYSLPHIPSRPAKPREDGLTMVMDKGISIRQAEDMVDACGHLVDIVKLGFGTSFVMPRLKEKIKLYQKANMKVYLGGTLFEAFIARGMFKDYQKLLDELELDTAEVSDGSINLPHAEKCKYITALAKDRTVLSEVGSKETGILISPAKWVRMMRTELDAGSWKVIAEARESGTVGIYRPNGHAHTTLVNRILAKVPAQDIMWEAPIKSQQVWFIKMLGPNVNLGNISAEEVIPLETLRLGLRGDTFFQYLPEAVVEKLKQVVPGSPPLPPATAPCPCHCYCPLPTAHCPLPTEHRPMQEIDARELKRMKDAGEVFQLIDVREPYEAEVCSLGGTLIPMGEIVERLAEVRKDMSVVVHCRSGARSASVISALSTRYGYSNLINLKGGILGYGRDVDPSLQCG